MSFADFDRYVEEHNVSPEDVPDAFGQWLANAAQAPILGGPVGEAPTMIAIPDENGRS